MNFKITLTKTNYYSEIGQKNPLRWKVMLLNDDGGFTDQTGWIKCKDFFNDTVAFFKAGSIFQVCGYTSKIEKNADGVYFLLKYIANFEQFDKNMFVVNKQLKKDLGCEMKFWPVDGKQDEVILLMPNELWETTYRISMATQCVRLCNNPIDFKKWDDLWSAYTSLGEHAFSVDALANAKKWAFLVPEKFRKYWYYAGPQHNSEVAPALTGGVIHNNGVSNWSCMMKMGM